MTCSKCGGVRTDVVVNLICCQDCDNVARFYPHDDPRPLLTIDEQMQALAYILYHQELRDRALRAEISS